MMQDKIYAKSYADKLNVSDLFIFYRNHMLRAEKK